MAMILEHVVAGKLEAGNEKEGKAKSDNPKEVANGQSQGPLGKI